MKRIIILIINIITINFLFAQNADTTKKSVLALWEFADIYYAYDFNQPQDHNRPSFIYSHNRHDEIALNNCILGVRYKRAKVRSALAFHTGTYVRANYAAESDILRLIYEANAGFQLFKNVWIDAGVFTSHIGCESAISFDNLTLSRSIMADNTPYYETGIKATFLPTEKLTLTALVLNGWQNIAENNNNKAISTQIQYKPYKNVLINSSTFFGKERPSYDSLSTMRYYHNFYIRIDIQKFTILAAFDIGIQNKRIESGCNFWYNPNLIVRIKPFDKISIAGRIEYYHDKNGIIIYSGTPNGFQTISPSLNFDYWITTNIAWRAEARLFNSKDDIFIKETNKKKDDMFVLSSLAIKL